MKVLTRTDNQTGRGRIIGEVEKHCLSGLTPDQMQRLTAGEKVRTTLYTWEILDLEDPKGPVEIQGYSHACGYHD